MSLKNWIKSLLYSVCNSLFNSTPWCSIPMLSQSLYKYHQLVLEYLLDDICSVKTVGLLMVAQQFIKQCWGEFKEFGTKKKIQL